MPPIGELTILIPVDVSESDPPALSVLDRLRPFEVILLGYFPVPDQAEPALIKGEYEAEAAERLDAIARERPEVTEVLVFTHDAAATIDRVAEQYDCELVLTGGDTAEIDRILVPIRGEANVERIASVVAGLLAETDATATLFHSVGEHGEPSQAAFLLRGTADRLADFGVDPDRVDWTVAEGGDPHRDIVEAAREHDIVVLGETEPSLRERIIGDVLSRIVADLDVPALIVRDV